jgi:hypothetical protein
MTLIDSVYDKVHGKYYLCYRYGSDFKRSSLYKWDGIFTEVHTTILRFKPYGAIVLSHDMSSPVYEHEDVMTFELDDNEEFRHVEMELITANL